jgi:hypothetical protein
MAANELGSEWQVAWATPRPHEEGYLDNLVLNREQAIEYGDELVQSLRIDGGILQEWGLDPEEPFAWTVKDGRIDTKQIQRRTLEVVAESDRDDSFHAQKILEYRAERRLRRLRSSPNKEDCK